MNNMNNMNIFDNENKNENLVINNSICNVCNAINTAQIMCNLTVENEKRDKILNSYENTIKKYNKENQLLNEIAIILNTQIMNLETIIRQYIVIIHSLQNDLIYLKFFSNQNDTITKQQQQQYINNNILELNSKTLSNNKYLSSFPPSPIVDLTDRI